MSIEQDLDVNEKTLSDEVKERLVQLREKNLSLLEQLGKEERQMQKYISMQTNKRQEFMIICVVACFLILFSLLLREDSFPKIGNIIFFVKMVLIAGSVACLGLAIYRIPGVLKYNGTWRNQKGLPTYNQSIEQCNQQIIDLRQQLKAVKEQFIELDKELLSEEDTK